MLASHPVAANFAEHVCSMSALLMNIFLIEVLFSLFLCVSVFW